MLCLRFPLRLPLVKRVRRYLGQQSEILGLRPRPKLASRRLVLLLRIFVVDIGAYGIEPPVNGDFDHHLFSELSLFQFLKFPHFPLYWVPCITNFLGLRLCFLPGARLRRNGLAPAIFEEVEILEAFTATPLWIADLGAAGRMTSVDTDGLGLRAKPPKINIGHREPWAEKLLSICLQF